MKNLSYNEIILLNNLIYLKWEAYEGEDVYELVANILNGNNLDILMNKEENCLNVTTKDEWKRILNCILKNPKLRNIKISNLENDISGMRAACFVYDTNKALVVFEGTTTIKEWEDNGQGAYEYDTDQQIYALNYVKSLKYEDIIVSGHSKGGNKAQYATIIYPKIRKCISINGQGFSNEFLQKYHKSINRNNSKIIAINSKYDYVNCLLNSISGETHFIKTELQRNPLFYHKANIILDENGKLREETNQCVIARLINEFSTSLISDLPKEVKSLTIDGLISGIETIMCNDKSDDKIIKAIGSIIIVLAYGRYFKMKETIVMSYTILEVLLMPLLLWGNFITLEETKSKDLYNSIINKIDDRSKELTKKLKKSSGKNKKITDKVIKHLNRFVDKLKKEEIFE